MPIPKPLVAFLAALAVTSAGANTSGAPVVTTSTTARAELVGATIGPHRFAFPKNLYYQQEGPDPDGGVMLGVQWPSLEPLPQGVDYHHDTADFISHISIDVSSPSRLSDTQYRRLLQRFIEPLNPDDKSERANPRKNLDLRIKGEPFHGLTPYLVDFDKLKRYYDDLYGPGTPASKPAHSEDWFIRMGPDGIPTTLITCSSRVIPDGASIENGRIVDAPGNGRRSTCNHSFLIPELRLVVDLMYLRIVMPHWQNIEARVRALIKDGEVRE